MLKEGEKSVCDTQIKTIKHWHVPRNEQTMREGRVLPFISRLPRVRTFYTRTSTASHTARRRWTPSEAGPLWDRQARWAPSQAPQHCPHATCICLDGPTPSFPPPRRGGAPSPNPSRRQNSAPVTRGQDVPVPTEPVCDNRQLKCFCSRAVKDMCRHLLPAPRSGALAQRPPPPPPDPREHGSGDRNRKREQSLPRVTWNTP